MHAFVAQNENELNFDTGDTILLEKQIGEDWFQGSCRGSTGQFPATFVVVVIPLRDYDDDEVERTDPVEDTPLTTKISTIDETVDPCCKAIFDYSSDLAEDLTFSSGDVIRLLEHVNEEWLRGMVGDRVGMFPKNFVEIICDLPKVASRKTSATKVPAAVSVFNVKFIHYCINFLSCCESQILSQIFLIIPWQKYFGPRVYPKGSLVIALVRLCVCVCVRPSVFKNLRDRSLFFSNFLHEVRAP